MPAFYSFLPLCCLFAAFAVTLPMLIELQDLRARPAELEKEKVD